MNKTLSIELEAENINDHRTKEYFHEVLVSFVNGNHRSAVVMLWSIVVADLVYKLKSLDDTYKDSKAKAILKWINVEQEKNPTSPQWEGDLLKKIYEETDLLEPHEFEQLKNLQKMRHLSAHPILKSDDLLFSPNKEEARSLIRNALEAILLKPPLLSKKFIDTIMLDILKNKELLLGDAVLERYLTAKFFENISSNLLHALIKALWK